MLRRLARLCRAAAAYLAPPSQINVRSHIAATSGRARSATAGSPSSALRSRGHARRSSFTPLRVEWLENRALLAPFDVASINVTADAHRYTEGETVRFTFTLAEPAPQAMQLDLLLSGGPAGPTGYVLPIAQGERSIHVPFPTADNTIAGDSYTLKLEIAGSSATGPGSSAGPFDSAATRVLDDDGAAAVRPEKGISPIIDGRARGG